MTSPEPWAQAAWEADLPEFRYCTRCDVCLPSGRTRELCEDCEGVDQFHPGGSHGGGFPPVDPAYEILLHFAKRPKNDRTIATLDALKMPYRTYTAKNDPLEVTFARSLFRAEPEWPLVLITSHGKVIDCWEGFDLNKLNATPAARAAAIQPPHTSVPDNKEQAA